MQVVSGGVAAHVHEPLSADGCDDRVGVVGGGKSRGYHVVVRRCHEHGVPGRQRCQVRHDGVDVCGELHEHEPPPRAEARRGLVDAGRELGVRQLAGGRHQRHGIAVRGERRGERHGPRRGTCDGEDRHTANSKVSLP
jgi:hypothetical protein